jgi:hypothetical protein
MAGSAAVHLALEDAERGRVKAADGRFESHPDHLGVRQPASPLINTTDALAEGIGSIDHQRKMAAIQGATGGILESPQPQRRDGMIAAQAGEGDQNGERSEPSWREP